jgi:hypothetical protein
VRGKYWAVLGFGHLTHHHGKVEGHSTGARTREDTSVKSQGGLSPGVSWGRHQTQGIWLVNVKKQKLWSKKCGHWPAQKS